MSSLGDGYINLPGILETSNLFFLCKAVILPPIFNYVNVDRLQ